ncbi:hypothetical protein AZE42_00106 [Rhizopogon vesiculosus]|uniref:Uncharacterized protein n=1 Tax=Rhizopogon vesiculosus TaxID=180088 RepID=A0A1J8QX44_9AGAM|nr:hypothetical protein AZE42_00106 [Rhizopogon vesiculosus]
MTIRRSNTEPQPLEHHARPHLARAKSTIDGFVPHSLPTSSQYRFSACLTAATPVATLRDREDPFSLGGFFPSYIVSPEREGERWEWLRQEQGSLVPPRDELHTIYSLSEGGADGSLPATPGPIVFARAAENVIEETIKGEDKMGVLSVINTIFLTKDAHLSDDKLYSPYAEDEAVDHESLYLALSKLRQAESSMPHSRKECVGDLFLEEEGSGVESDSWSKWWPVQWALHALSSIV